MKQIKSSIDSHDWDIRSTEKPCAHCRYYKQRPGLVQGYCRLRVDKDDDESVPVMPYETCDRFTA